MGNYNTKRKIIIFISAFIFMLIVLAVTDNLYYKKIDSISNEADVNVYYELDEDGFEKKE